MEIRGLFYIWSWLMMDVGCGYGFNTVEGERRSREISRG